LNAEEMTNVHKSEMLQVATELCEIRKREKVLLVRYDQLQIILAAVEQLTNDESKDANVKDE